MINDLYDTRQNLLRVLDITYDFDRFVSLQRMLDIVEYKIECKRTPYYHNHRSMNFRTMTEQAQRSIKSINPKEAMKLNGYKPLSDSKTDKNWWYALSDTLFFG